MVRFIMQENWNKQFEYTKIYIPIWLDLLYINDDEALFKYHHLHSNMVRFIMTMNEIQATRSERFTFQYG